MLEFEIIGGKQIHRPTLNILKDLRAQKKLKAPFRGALFQLALGDHPLLGPVDFEKIGRGEFLERFGQLVEEKGNKIVFKDGVHLGTVKEFTANSIARNQKRIT